MSKPVQTAFSTITLLFPMLMTPIFSADSTVITDFTNSTNDLQWTIQNDGVMGGLSVGGFETRPDHLYFTGNTNTNGGGFSSIRLMELELDLSAYDGIELNIQGDGRRYSWSLQTDATLRGRKISYWADFKTDENKLITVKIPFKDFHPQFRGTKLGGPPLTPDNITGMSLYIADGKDGPFSVKLYSAGTY